MYFRNSVRLKNTFCLLPPPHLNTVISSKWIVSDYWQKSFPHWNGWNWVFSFALQVLCSFSPMALWSKAPNKLHVCAQILRLLAFTEHGKATEIKHSHWVYSYTDIQNYSQCWEILGGREEDRNAWGSWLLSMSSSDLTLRKPADQLASTRHPLLLLVPGTSWQHLYIHKH